MEERWVKLHSKLLDWEWFKDGYTLRVFIYMLFDASHKKEKRYGIDLEAGMVATNVPLIASMTQMSENWARRSLNNLLKTGELVLVGEKSSSRFRVYRIANWRKYQATPHDTDSTSCTSQCEPHNVQSTSCGQRPHNVEATIDNINSIINNREEREDVINSAREDEPHNVQSTSCTSQRGGQKTDTDIPQAPYNPSQGYGAPPIIPYPQTAKEVMDTAALRGISMTEAEANDFINYYGGLGWMLGKSPIRNWTMFIPKWHENSKNRSVNNGNSTRNGFDRKHVASADEFGEGDQY